MLAFRQYDPVRRLRRARDRAIAEAEEAWSRGDLVRHADIQAEIQRFVQEMRQVRGWLE